MLISNRDNSKGELPMPKDNKNNRRYTKLEKEELVQRMLPPESILITELSIETGISKSTLATWKSKTIGGAASKPKIKKSSKDKFMIVMETYTLSEIELSKYCRENGIYVEDVKKWRSSCMAANDGVKANVTKLEEESKGDKRVIKRIKSKRKGIS